MLPRPGLAAASLVVLALLHAFSGARVLLESELLRSASQLVSAGGLLLAAVGVAHGSRGSCAAGLAIAAAATALRVFPALAAGITPFFAGTLVLSAGMAAMAWGCLREDARAGPALRGGAFAMALAYAVFVAGMVTLGARTADVVDVAVRIAAALTVAVAIDAPPLIPRAQRASSPSAAATSPSTPPVPRS